MGNRILLIIAAGNSTRMGSLPKAASLINGVPNLYNTVSKAYDIFSTIIVVSNEDNLQLYNEIISDFNDKTFVISIESGYGCGHAVMESLNSLSEKSITANGLCDSDIVICWGDAYFENSLLFEELISIPKEVMEKTNLLIPVIMEKDPYVDIRPMGTIEVNNTEFITASHPCFKKRNETILGSSGFHDQSIFRINYGIIKYLDMYHKSIYRKRDIMKRYIYGEMVFLDVINIMANYNNNACMYLTQHHTLGFNDTGELKQINEQLKRYKNEKF